MAGAQIARVDEGETEGSSSPPRAPREETRAGPREKEKGGGPPPSGPSPESTDVRFVRWVRRALWLSLYVLVLGWLALLMVRASQGAGAFLPARASQAAAALTAPGSLAVALVGLVCVLPLLACPLVAFIAAIRAGEQDSLPRAAVSLPPGWPQQMQPLVEHCEGVWRYEKSRGRVLARRSRNFASLCGLLTTVVLLSELSLLVYAQALGRYWGTEPQTLRVVAVGAASATLMTFAITVYGACNRVALLSLTPGFFASAIAAVFQATGATTGVMLVGGLIGIPALSNKVLPGLAVGTGLGIAILGSDAYSFLRSKFSKALGVGLRGTEVNPIPFLSDVELQALREIDITSLPELVGTSVPRLFFATPFGLDRIVGWQGAALLADIAGEKGAQRLALKGIRSVRQVMGARPGPATSAAGDDARSMDFDVTGTLELIRRDPRVHLLEVFATSVLSLPDAREA